MTAWIVAALVGVGVACVGYLPTRRRSPTVGWLAALRALATGLIAAVALGAPVRGRTRDAPLVVLDVSASWTRAAAPSAFGAARDSARRLAADAGSPVAAVGESLRVAPAAGPPGAGSDPRPRDRATRIAAAAESAAATARSLTLVTDGEVDDAETLARAPAGSRVVVLRPTRGPDAAVVDVQAPLDLAPGDTATLTVTVGADSAGSAPGRVGIRLDRGPAVERPVPALGAYGRASIALRLAVRDDARAHAAVLDAFVAVPGDPERRNDTVSRMIEITSAPRAVVVSSAPDLDVGVALSVLRGALSVPVRAYYRVAPGAWRVSGTLVPVRESEVRAAAARAALLVLHGDTAVLGSPRTLGHGALALFATGAVRDSTSDWYAAPAPGPGPLAALTGLPWDSLPPLDVPAAGADAAARLAQRWTGVVARAGRSGPARVIIAGGIDAAGRRIAIVEAGGFWRWGFRSGPGAAAASAVWGAVFDWLADAPAATTPTLTPAATAVRSGALVPWRGLAARDSIARVRLTPRDGRGAVTVVVHRDLETGEARSDSPGPGVYDVPGGSILVVNASTELLPRRPALRAGPLGLTRAASDPPTAPITPGWPLALATSLLCAEWVARRRVGLR